MLNTLLKELKHFIIPHFCSYCRIFLKSNDILCTECLKEITPLVSHQLKITQKVLVPVFALSSYTEPIKSLILSKASSNILASKQLATLLWRYSILKHQSFDIIVPIPLHWTRYAYRGYNQAAVMAKELSRLSGKPYANLLQRTKRTPILSSLPVARRYETVKEVFSLQVDKHQLKDKNILLIDDLMTTGSTLIAACKQLNKSKPASINIAVAARVIGQK